MSDILATLKDSLRFLRITPDQIEAAINEITRLRAELATAKADAWDEGFNEGVGRDQDFYDLQHINPYRSKT